MILIDPTVRISSWKTSQYASSWEAENKHQKQPCFDTTDHHPFILSSGYHAGRFLNLTLWSSDCVSVYFSLYFWQRSADERLAGLILHVKPFNDFPPLTSKSSAVVACVNCVLLYLQHYQSMWLKEMIHSCLWRWPVYPIGLGISYSARVSSFLSELADPPSVTNSAHSRGLRGLTSGQRSDIAGLVSFFTD